MTTQNLLELKIHKLSREQYDTIPNEDIDLNALYLLPEQEASTEAAGLMSAADKVKLDTILDILYPVGALFRSAKKNPPTIGKWQMTTGESNTVPISGEAILDEGGHIDGYSFIGRGYKKVVLTNLNENTNTSLSKIHYDAGSGYVYWDLVTKHQGAFVSGSINASELAFYEYERTE